MKNVHFLRCLILAVIGFFLSDSTKAYQFNTKENFDNYFNNLHAVRDKHFEIHKNRNILFADFLNQTSTPGAEAYLQLTKALENMKNHADLYAAKLAELGIIRLQMNLIFGKTGEVRSDDKDNWKAFQKLDIELKKGAKELYAEGDFFYSADNNFVDLSNKYGLKTMVTKNLQEQIRSNLEKLDAALAEARKKIPEAQEAVKKFAGTKEAVEKQKALDAMVLLLGDIEKKRQEIAVGVDLFNQKVVKIEKLYEGPGMKKITIFEEIKAKANEINDLTHKFNDQANKLR